MTSARAAGRRRQRARKLREEIPVPLARPPETKLEDRIHRKGELQCKLFLMESPLWLNNDFIPGEGEFYHLVFQQAKHRHI